MGSTLFTRGARYLAPGMLFLLLTVPAGAETHKLTLPQLIGLTLRGNAGLQAFREEKGIYEAEKQRAGLLPNPVLDLEGGTGALTGAAAENSLAVGISQDFLLGDKRSKRTAVAERDLEIYRWQAAERERALRLEVSTAFYDLALAEARLALNRRVTHLNRQLLELTRERLAAGDIPELEMNLVKVELTRSETGGIEMERSLQESRTRLQAATGRPWVEALALEGALEARHPLTWNLAELKGVALANRPDLRALAAESSKGDAELELARAEGIPNLTAGLVLRRDSTSMEIGGVEGKDTAYTVGVKLSLPLAVFDRNRSGIGAARARQLSAQGRRGAAARTVECEVEGAYAGLAGADQVLSRYLSGIIPQLGENLALTQEAYRLGEVGILALLEEQKKFFEVNDRYLAAQHARQTALVKLEAAVATDLSGGVK